MELKMDIQEAKRSLFDSLKNIDEVQGVGVGKENESSYLIVYLKGTRKKILENLPNEIGGIKVFHKIIGLIKPLHYQ